MKARITAAALISLALACTPSALLAQAKHQNLVIDLWEAGKPAFGVYATTEGQPLPGQPTPNAGQRGGAPAPQGQRGGPPNPDQIRQQIATLQQQLQQLEAGGGRGGGRGAAPTTPDLGYTVAVGQALAKNPLYDYIFLNPIGRAHV